MTIRELAGLVADIIAAPFRPSDVNSVVAAMEKQVDRLFDVAATNIAKADHLREQGDELIVKANEKYHEGNAAEDEADRALRVAERFTALIR